MRDAPSVTVPREAGRTGLAGEAGRTRLAGEAGRTGPAAAPDPIDAALGGAPAILVARGVAVAATGGAWLLAARVLGVATFGRYATLVAAASVVALIAGMQLDAQAARTRSSAALRRLARRARRAGAASAVVAVAAGAVTATAAPAETVPVLLLVPLLVVSPRLLVLVGAARARGRLRRVAWLTAATPVARLAALGGVLLVTGGFTVAAAIAVHALAPVAVWAVARRGEPDLRRAPATDPAPPRRSVSIEAVSLALASGAWLLVQRSDLLMLRALRGAEVVGEYEAALRLTELPQDLYGAAIVMFVPAAARLDPARIRALAGRLNRALVAILAPAMATLAVFGADLVRVLFGPGFDVPPAVLGLLVAGTAATVATGPVGALMVARRRHRTILRVSLAGVGANLALNAVLVPLHGAVGAAVATALSLATINGAYLVASRRELGGWFAPADWGRAAAVAGVAVGVALVVRSALAGVATGAATAAAALLVAAAATGLLARRDLAGLLTSLRAAHQAPRPRATATTVLASRNRSQPSDQFSM